LDSNLKREPKNKLWLYLNYRFQYQTLLSEKLFRISFQNQEQVLGQISAKQTDREVKRILQIKLRFVKVKQVKHFIG